MKWQKPPKRAGGRGMAQMITEHVEALKKHPGEWAVVREDVKTAGPARTYKNRGCIAVSHRTNTAPDRFDIYAMWPVEETPDVKGDDAIVDVIGEDCG